VLFSNLGNVHMDRSARLTNQFVVEPLVIHWMCLPIARRPVYTPIDAWSDVLFSRRPERK
jgi:hypothetical protein